jgi:hypothetical protein
MITTRDKVVHLTTRDDIAALADAIRASEPAGRPIVALTSRTGQRHPALDAGEVRRIVGDGVRVYFIEDGPLTRELSRLLPPEHGVYGGAARIWRPPVDQRSNPLDHPLIHDYYRVYGTRTLDTFRLRFESGAPTSRRAVADPKLEFALHDRDESTRRLRVLQEENIQLIQGRDRAIQRAAAAEREARDARREIRARSGQRPNRHESADAAAVFRCAVLDAWLEALSEDDRNRYPLAVYRINNAFTNSLAVLPRTAQQRAPWVCAMVLCDRARELPSLELHRLRGGPGGEDAPRTRKRDGATAWRCSVKRNTPAAARLHYWRTADGSVELASVGHHDDFEIPE